MTRAEVKSRTLNGLNHPGTPDKRVLKHMAMSHVVYGMYKSATLTYIAVSLLYYPPQAEMRS